MSGARPSESSSARSTFGSRPSARASDSICCSPPEHSPAPRPRIPSRAGKYAHATFGSTPANRRFSATDIFMITERPSTT
jgi:hypothetical protein